MLDRYDENLILGYIEGELPSDERAAFEALLAEDAQLRTLVQSMVDDRALLRQVPAVEAPASILASVSASLERDMLLGNHVETGPYRFPTWARRTASIAAILLVAVGLTWQFDPFGWQPAGNNTGIENASPGDPNIIAMGTGEGKESDHDRGNQQNLQGQRLGHNLEQNGKSLSQDKFKYADHNINERGVSIQLASADLQSTRDELAAWANANNAVFVSASEKQALESLAMEQLAKRIAANRNRSHPSLAGAGKNDAVVRRSHPEPLSTDPAVPARPAPTAVANANEKEDPSILNKRDQVKPERANDDQTTDPRANSVRAKSIPNKNSPAKNTQTKNVQAKDVQADQVQRTPTAPGARAVAKANVGDQSKSKAERKPDAEAVSDTTAESVASAAGGPPPLTKSDESGVPGDTDTLELEESLASRASDGTHQLAIAVPEDRVDELLAHLREKFGDDRVVVSSQLGRPSESRDETSDDGHEADLDHSPLRQADAGTGTNAKSKANANTGADTGAKLATKPSPDVADANASRIKDKPSGGLNAPPRPDGDVKASGAPIAPPASTPAPVTKPRPFDTPKTAPKPAPGDGKADSADEAKDRAGSTTKDEPERANRANRANRAVKQSPKDVPRSFGKGTDGKNADGKGRYEEGTAEKNTAEKSTNARPTQSDSAAGSNAGAELLKNESSAKKMTADKAKLAESQSVGKNGAKASAAAAPSDHGDSWANEGSGLKKLNRHVIVSITIRSADLPATRPINGPAKETNEDKSHSAEESKK